MMKAMEVPRIKTDFFDGFSVYFSRWFEVSLEAEATPTEPGTYIRDGLVTVLLPLSGAFLDDKDELAKMLPTIEEMIRYSAARTAEKERLAGPYRILAQVGVAKPIDLPNTGDGSYDEEKREM